VNDHLEVLRNFNEWRRGAEIALPPMREIGLSIHAVIDELETLRKMVNIPAKSLSLPYPPSTNRLIRIGSGRAYQSPEARYWKIKAAWKAKQEGATISDKPMSLTIMLHPRAKKDGSPSKSRIDIDNSIKAVCDALNGVAWHDDRQVVRVVAEVSDPLPDGGLTVLWCDA
jgi:crossover junction endodeoxyribonuclease RusA